MTADDPYGMLTPAHQAFGSYEVLTERRDRGPGAGFVPSVDAMTPTATRAPSASPVPTAPRRRRTRLALGGALVLVAGTLVWGQVLRARGGLPIDGLPPFHTVPRLLTWSMWPAVAYAAAMAVVLPRLARLRWPAALGTAWMAAVGWAVSLAVTDGVSRLWTPLTTKYAYLAGLSAVGDHPLTWLRGFTHALPAYPEHVKGHPPLPVIVLWALDHAGLHGPVPAAALMVGAGCAAVPAIAITVRIVAGPVHARRALPFLVLAPTAMFVATSMDAFFLGVTAGGIALVAVAAHRHAVLPAVAGGVLLGAAPYLSYALLTLGAPILAVLIATRPPRRVVLAGIAGGLVVPAAMTAAGFWWPDGVAATSGAWAASAGGNRPYGYFLLGDLAVLAAVLGPAVLAGLGRLRGTEWRTWILPAAAFIAVMALDVAGITRGEVERIWLPYAAWMVTGAAALRGPARGWLAAQAGTAVVMQALMGSPW